MNATTLPATTALQLRPSPAQVAIPHPARGTPNRHAAFKLPLLVAVLAALGTSVLLIPGGQEMAQLRLGAGDAVGARALLEQRHAAGERSPAILAALAALRARTGDLPGAVALLEPLAIERPHDQEVLDALLIYRRQQADDPAGLLRVLVMLDALAPSVPRQREIAWLHGRLGQVGAQRAAHERLIAAGHGEAADHLALARIASASGNAMEGLAALRILAATYPAAFDANAAALAVALWLDAGNAEAAAAAASEWLTGQDRMAALAAAPVLASILGGAGRPDLVRALLAPLAGHDVPIGLTLALALAQAEIDDGSPAAAFDRLSALSDTALDRAPELRLLRLRVALALSHAEHAARDLAAMPRHAVPPGLAERVAAAALEAGRSDILGRLLDWGGANLLAAQPGLAAEVALLLGEPDVAARWADAALAGAPPRTAARGLGLAATLATLDRAEDAATVLAQVVTAPDITAPMLLNAARGFLRIGRAERGLVLFDALRLRTPSITNQTAWALMAAALPHHEAALVAWLESGAGPPDADALRDILHVAADAGARSAAIAAARRLLAQHDSDADRVLLARLLVDAGRPGEALSELRILATRGMSDPPLYESTLHAAWRQGAGATGELRALWAARLNAAASPHGREAAIAMLRELGAEADALPLLRQMAEADPERWLWRYGEAAERINRPLEALELRRVIARREDVPVALRRQLAFGLLERGERSEAEPVFRSLAANAPPDSAEVRQLLFVWGPRPARAELAWVEARARAAGGAEKAAWMRLLIERGAAGRAIAAYRGARGNGDAGPAREAYLTALAVAQDRAGLAAAVREEAARENTRERLQALAILAGQSGSGALEDRVLRLLVLAGGGDTAQRKRVGLAAWREGDLGLAGQLLDERVRAGGGDAETLFILGEIRQRQGEGDAAQRFWSLALQRVAADRDTSPVARRLQATLLRRIGRSREALPLYEALLTERPADGNLRADLVALLIDLRDYRRAQTLLAER